MSIPIEKYASRSMPSITDRTTLCAMNIKVTKIYIRSNIQAALTALEGHFYNVATP